jgi:outer membrane protein OmpA-like peptidoglycan-associated protein
MSLRMFFFAVFLSISVIALSSPVHAEPLDEAIAAIAEAKALRASEFSPHHFSKATEKLAKAERLLLSHPDTNKAEHLLNEATTHARQASELSQKFTSTFSNLVESRDRLKLAGDDYIRDDLGQRSRKEFSRVVKAVERGNFAKARREEKITLLTFRAALSVASREQFVRPISKTIARARKLKARNYAPNSLKNALTIQTKVERLIKSNPEAQSKAYSLSRQGKEAATHAIRISRLGSQFDRNPETLESWIDASDARMAILAETVGLHLDRSQSPEMQLSQLKQAVEDIKAEHIAQINDAEKQLHALGEKLAKNEEKLAKYEGKLTAYEGELSDMAEIRRKLQLKREAEAKIKRLTKLFDPEMVEILLTPDADVILRMKKLNFLSGSAVIPPEAYGLLDNAIKSIEIFPNRTARIEGHTDFMGTNEYNQELSNRRANAVRDYLLLQMPHNETRFAAIGHGEEKPIANNETAEGRTRNRRIDIILLAPAATAIEQQVQ